MVPPFKPYLVKSHIDALGPRPERRRVFSSGLLAEEEDPELTRIVEHAAADLGAPIALVTLVLDRVQFFKAHFGLPPDLAATRTTERDVSFCQFLVRDDAPLEVCDASRDEQLPQALVARYGIQSYLGFPLRMRGAVIGSLCVLDSKPRTFSKDDRTRLSVLAKQANVRLEALEMRHSRVQAELARGVVPSGLTELRQTLQGAEQNRESLRVAARTLRMLLQGIEYDASGESVPPGVREARLRQARLAMQDLEDSATELEFGLRDADDCVRALEGAVVPGGLGMLGEVLEAAQDLARHPCRKIGGAPLPALSFDAPLASPRSLAISTLAHAYGQLAAQAASSTRGLDTRVDRLDDPMRAVVTIASPDLSSASLVDAVRRLAGHIGHDPNLQVEARDGSMRITLRITQAPSSPRDP